MQELLQDLSPVIQLLIVMATFSLLPMVFACMTSFLRCVIVLSLVKTGIGTQQVPPAIVLIGLSMMITIYTMMPTFNQMYEAAYAPYRETGSAIIAMQEGSRPLKEFMMKQTREQDAMFMNELMKSKAPETPADMTLMQVMPAFIMSELRSAFEIGFLLLIPFVIVEILVSNILLALGMFMLSPTVIAIPFKLLIFLGADGWNLITKGFLNSFN